MSETGGERLDWQIDEEQGEGQTSGGKGFVVIMWWQKGGENWREADCRIIW